MNVITECETEFAPTAAQIEFAKEYIADTGTHSVLVAVNFPGKQRGIWTEGQTKEAVMDGDEPALWTIRDLALADFDSGYFGNAMFRVYSDGHCHLVDEA